MNWQGAALAVLLAACTASSPQQDALYPSCNDAPTEGLESEATTAGQCPAHPTMLVGHGTVGSSCSAATDCAPTCCTCNGGQAALVAQCAHGGCLDAGDTCCLFSLQCAN